MAKRKRKVIVLDDPSTFKEVKSSAGETLKKGKSYAGGQLKKGKNYAGAQVRKGKNYAGSTFKKGAMSLKSKDTLKRVGKLAGGSLISRVAVILVNKVTSGTSQAFQYAVGSVASGVITAGAMGMNWDDVGYGSAMVTAEQLINTGSSLITGKSISENLNRR